MNGLPNPRGRPDGRPPPDLEGDGEERATPEAPAAGLALVLLAAGSSQRLGRCKALVPLGEDPGDCALSRLLEAGGVLGDSRPLVVAGAHFEQLNRAAPVEVIRNTRWSEGRTGSVAVAARARRDRDLLLAPVDVPRVPAAVFEALSLAWEAAGRPERGWLAPFVEGTVAQRGEASAARRRFGHPIVLGRGLGRRLAELLADESDAGWRARPLWTWREVASPLLSLRVESPEILEDLDTPEDLERLRGMRPGETR